MKVIWLLLWRPLTVLTMSYWSHLINPSLLLLTAMLLCTLSCFDLNSWTAVAARCQGGKPDFGIRSECMSAENLCTTYYLVLLFSMWTPALRCGVYLFTCLCLTLCAHHRRSLLCSFRFGWFMMKRLWDELSILISHTYWLFIFPSRVIGRPLWPCSPLSCPPTYFLYFDTNFDYVYCPSYSELVKAF